MINSFDVDALLFKIKERFPDFQVGFKDKSPLMKVLGFVLKPFCPTFMEHYTTTIGHKVYVPSEDFLKKSRVAFAVLAHEFVHMVDESNEGRLLFRFKYLFPQVLFLILAPLAVASYFVSPWACLVLGLLAVLSLLPWPAKFRTEYEFRGYRMSQAVEYWLTGRVWNPESADLIGSNFTNFNYYRMSWSSVKNRIQQDGRYFIKTGGILMVDPYYDVYHLLEDLGRIHSSVEGTK